MRNFILVLQNLFLIGILMIHAEALDAACGDSNRMNLWLQLFQSGSLDADVNNDGRLSGADYNAFIHNDCSTDLHSNGMIPVNFLAPGIADPYSELMGGSNRCPEGSLPVEIIEKRSVAGEPFQDMPLVVCMASTDDTGGFSIPEEDGREVLHFGGAFGQYKDYVTPNPDPITGSPLWHSNPYTGDRTCDESKGFQSYKVYGFSGSDWGINVCLAKLSSSTSTPYPNKRFHGFVSSPSACARGEAKIIHGTTGSPPSDSSVDMDLDLYMCIEDEDDPNNGESLADVVGLKLIGLNSYEDDTSANLVVADLQTTTRVPYDAAFAFTIKADVSYFDGVNSRIVQEDFPHSISQPGDIQIPFRVRFTQTGATNRSPQTTMKFAPYTINYTNESPDGSQTIYFFVSGANSIGNYSVKAEPIAADSDEVIGDSITVNFEIYDPDDGNNNNDDDTRSPEAPSNLREVSTTSSRTTLAWDAALDLPDGNIPASGVTGYRVYESSNQVALQSTGSTSMTIYGLQADTDYRFKVSALDAAGNESLLSDEIELTTDEDDGNNQDQLGGWTEIVPSPDSRVMYVSSSHPNASDDSSNDGLSPDQPLKTAKEAYRRLRDGYPDHVLLKRGDVFRERLNDWKKGGRNRSEKMLLGAYGEGPRPVIETDGNGSAISGIKYTIPNRKHLAFVGLHLRSPVPTGAVGFSFVTDDFDDVLIEDLKIQNFDRGMVIQNNNWDDDFMEDVVIRRCIIMQNQGSSHSQGIFAMGIHPFTIEENVLYQNGWTESEGRENSATIFAQGIYVQRIAEFTQPRAYRNIIIDTANAGIQFRDGGIVEGNVFVKNPLAVMVGNEQNHRDERPRYARVKDNIILDPIDLRPSYGQGWGVVFQNMRNDPITGAVSEISDNILSNTNREADQAKAILTSGKNGNTGNDGLNVTRNIVRNFQVALSHGNNFNFSRDILFSENDIFTNYKDALIYDLFRLNGNDYDLRFSNNRYSSSRSEIFRVSNDGLTYSQWMSLQGPDGNYDTNSVMERPSYLDEERNLDSYARSIGLSGEDELFQELVNLRRGDWPRIYSADSISDYIREGFVEQ